MLNQFMDVLKVNNKNNIQLSVHSESISEVFPNVT